MSLSLDDLLALPYASLAQKEKERALLPLMAAAVQHHLAACPPYARIVQQAFAPSATALSDLPFLPISLFKNRRLVSIPEEDVRVAVQSSGTTATGQSQIQMNAAEARRTAQTLAALFRDTLGDKRLPMLIIDTPAVLQKSRDVGARAAAILGLMPFGHEHCFVLTDDFQLDRSLVGAFLKKHGHAPFLIYGFTYLVWSCLLPACTAEGWDLSHGLLLHSGGWKKLQEISVDNATFHARFEEAAGLRRIVNFYGMAEMPGIVFLENTDGLLYPPAFADVIIRDPVTLDEKPIGEEGLIQLVNPLPRSYPGPMLLTEDMGVIEHIDAGVGGWFGKALRLTRRAARAELRGCSDVLAQKDGARA